MIMKKKTTGSFTSRLRRIMLAWFLGIAAVLSAYAQGSCPDVDLSDITTAPATCEGNGSVTAPTYTGAAYTLVGTGYNVGPQSSSTFNNLSPGTYTLNVLCLGSTTPVAISGIVVENRHQQLALNLTSTIPCPGTGTITATATFGYNKGEGDATYEFAIWQGAAGLPDGSLTWVSPLGNQHVFTGLSTGTYQVRVRDKCGNVWTSPHTIGAATTPTANLTHGATWVCDGGNIVRRVTLNANNIVAAVRYTGYTYKVEYVANGGSATCAAQESLGTAIAETAITEANYAALGFDITTANRPAGAGGYRITVTSPCGGVSQSCQIIPDQQLNISLNRSYMSCTDGSTGPNPGANTRLTYALSGNGYTLTYPATLVLTGTGFNQTINIANADGLTGVLENVPNSAYTITATFTSGCATRTVTVNALGGTLATTLPTASYARSCVDLDHTNVSFNLNGNYLWGQSYVLYNADRSVEIVGTITNPITNTLTFANVPVGDTYHVDITPTTASGCTLVQKLGPLTIPGGSTGQGAYIRANPEITVVCNNNTSQWNWDFTTNYAATTDRTVRFKVWAVGGDPVAGPFVHNATNSNAFAIVPGEYMWSVEVSYPGEGCSQTLQATVPIVVTAVQSVPTISKSVASVCQDENGAPLTTGLVILEYTGNGPFLIERRDAAGSVNSWTTVAGGVTATTYTIDDLEAGKTYIFRITDQCGRSVTQQASIMPLSPRIIKLDDVPQICVGSPYTIEGIDYPGATYEWIRLSDDVVVSTDKDLTFSEYTAADAGSYKLVMRLGDCVARETTITLGITEGCGDPFQLGSLGNYVWYDTNYDGLQDDDELGASGVSVTLQGYTGPANPTPADLANSTNWSDIETQTTDGDGLYKFTNLPGGYYRVRFGDVPDYSYTGYQQGAADSDNRTEGGDSNADPANGNYSGPVLIEVNHSPGDVRRDNMTIDAGLVRYGSIGDYVWFDTDLDGIQDAGEAPVKDVTVNLWIKDGETWVSTGRTTTTDATGKYLFDNLKPGTYQVEFVKPAGNDFTLNYVGGASSTAPTDSDANRTTGKSGEIVIDVSLPKGNVGRDNMTIDAGLVPEGALPVKLSRFSAEKTTEGAALLTWATTEEKNSAYFDVLQSVDATNWQAIGRVEAGGNSLTTAKYSFTDFTPAKGVNYYRLKMVDLDGSFDHSNIRSLTFEGTPLDLSVYPNPVSDRFSIKVGAREKISKVELFDSNGRRAIVSDRYTAGESIITKGLSAGTYVLKVTMNNGAVEIRKIVISNK